MKTKNYVGCMSAYGLSALEEDHEGWRSRFSCGVLRGNMSDRRDMAVMFKLKLPTQYAINKRKNQYAPRPGKVVNTLLRMGWMDCMNTIRLIKKLPIKVVEVDDSTSSAKKQEGYLRQLPTSKRMGPLYERDDDVFVYWKRDWRDQVHELKEYFKDKCGISFDQYAFNIRENQYA